MAENNKLTAEQRLEKATACYKEMKEKYEAAAARVKELEDELIINGSASEEVKALNARLDKAKAIFAEQKATIKNLTEEANASKVRVESLTAELERVSVAHKEAETAYNDVVAAFQNTAKSLVEVLDAIPVEAKYKIAPSEE